MEMLFASCLIPGFIAGCASPAPGRGFGGTECGMRPLTSVTAVSDLIIWVTCVLKTIVVLLREGNLGLGGGPPKKSHPELGAAGISAFPDSSKSSGCENTPGAHLCDAQEGFCCVCMAIPRASQSLARKISPIFPQKLF